jgi:xanthine/uracil permease
VTRLNDIKLNAITRKMTLMPIPSVSERAISFVVLAISFLVVGLGSLFLRNVPVAAGLLMASLFWLLVALFYLTKEHREKAHKIMVA